MVFMKTTRLHQLAKYLKAERGRASALAKHLGISHSYLSQMLSGDRPMPPEMCPEVEAFSNGAVRRQDCRPNDGDRIWPESATCSREVAHG